MWAIATPSKAKIKLLGEKVRALRPPLHLAAVFKILVWRRYPGKFPLLFLMSLSLERSEDKGCHRCGPDEDGKRAVCSKWETRMSG